MKLAAAAVSIGILAGSLSAQPTTPKSPVFDVASVKQNKSDDPAFANIPTGPGNAYTPNGGYFVGKNLPLLAYIAFAWRLSAADFKYLVPQMPAWVSSNRFDIQARAGSNPDKDTMRLMMRALLADRFRLVIHTESREVPVSAMVLLKAGRTGPQLQLHPADAACTTLSDSNAPPATSVPLVNGGFPLTCGGIYLLPAQTPGNQRLAARNIPMDFLARSIPTTETDRPLVNRTGITENIDFVLEFLPSRNGAQQQVGNPEAEPSGPTLQEALAKQLGIRLESTKAPVEVLVFDHIEHLTDN